MSWDYLNNLACFLKFGEVVTIGPIFCITSDDTEGFEAFEAIGSGGFLFGGAFELG